MTFLNQLRRRSRLIRSVFAVVVLAWLQTALLPCALAALGPEPSMHSVFGQSSDEATPNARTATSAMSDMPDCVYCPSEQKQSGDMGSSVHACFYPHESRVDSGKAQQLQLDQQLAHPTFISASVFSFLLAPTEALPSPRYLSPPVAERSLNLTYCKQLQ